MPSPPFLLLLGAPRTASTSTAAALRQLGYHPYIGVPTAMERGDFAAWTAILASPSSSSSSSSSDPDVTARLHHLLRDYDAVSGWAAALLARELLDAFPDAKVVLTVRGNERAWNESFEGSIRKVHGRCKRMGWVWVLGGGEERQFARFVLAAMGVWERRQGGRGVAGHEEWVRGLVRERGREENLLEFRPAMGWTPLCEFLGVKVPEDVEFPRLAGRQSIEGLLEGIWGRVVRRAMWRAGIGLGIAAVAYMGMFGGVLFEGSYI